MSETTDAWDNYWQGRAGTRANALTGVEHDKELRTFWETALSDIDKTAPYLDMACGAGTVLQAARDLGFQDITGADVSEGAIAALKARFPDVKTCVSDASQTPFEDQAFAIMTSQFGFEYADPIKTASEIVRILRPKGQFIAVCHMTDGAIAREVKGHLDVSMTIADSAYIPRSKALFSAALGRDKAAMNEAVQALTPARDVVMAMAQTKGSGFAKHLIAGAAQMWERRQNYAPDDIMAWFDAMEAERAAYAMRMQDMLDAAMTKAEGDAVCDVLRAGGCDVSPLQPFILGGAEAAWIIKATRDS